MATIQDLQHTIQWRFSDIWLTEAIMSPRQKFEIEKKYFTECCLISHLIDVTTSMDLSERNWSLVKCLAQIKMLKNSLNWLHLICVLSSLKGSSSTSSCWLGAAAAGLAYIFYYLFIMTLIIVLWCFYIIRDYLNFVVAIKRENFTNKLLLFLVFCAMFSLRSSL